MTGAGPAPALDGLEVLVVDDEADLRLGLRRLLGGLGLSPRTAADGREALEVLARARADLVITDLSMPGMGGLELLTEVKRAFPSTEVVVLTGFGTVQAAVQCLQAGAAHFLTKPFDNEEVLGIVRRLGSQLLAGRRAAAGRLAQGRSGIVAEDPRMAAVLELVRRVARSPVPVLVEGESGTGKELVARELHACSPVAAGPFRAVNCAALPDALLESELFGHVRGAFTGAVRDRDGLFREAAGGTVFLDEVSSMSPSFQGKLLRVLQEKTVRPVGGRGDVPVDFRLVAATNRELGPLVAGEAFREDLYYRLQVVRVRIPPLRERPGDIAPLTRHLLARAAAESLGEAAAAPALSDEALAALHAHAWPGNVRELENAIRRAVVVCCGDRILPYHLGLDAGTGADPGAAAGGASAEAVAGCAEPGRAPADYALAKRRALDRFQREFVQRALERSGGNVSRAAEACGLTRVALQKILRQLGIDRTAFGPGEPDPD